VLPTPVISLVKSNPCCFLADDEHVRTVQQYIIIQQHNTEIIFRNYQIGALYLESFTEDRNNIRKSVP